MKHIVIIILLLTHSAIYADDFLPGNAAKGKKLHNQNCVSCHGTDVYTRSNRIGSLGGLQKRVQMCSTMLNRDISKDDEVNIVKYLSAIFYKFKSE